MPVAYAEPENRARGRRKEGDRGGRKREGRRRGRRKRRERGRTWRGTRERFFLQSWLMNEVAGSVSITCPRLLC